MFSQLVLEHPWWLILLIPLAIGVLKRVPSAYLSKAHSYIAPIFLNRKAKIRHSWQRFAFAVPNLAKIIVLVFIVAALIDITRGYTVVVGQKTSQRLIVALDVSSSMYGFGASFSSITCERNSVLFPRIKGACRALYRLLGDVERETRDEKNPRVLLGLMQFAGNSAVVSYPTSDYARFRKKIDILEFRSHGLGISTNMHTAMWDMFLVALNRNLEANSGFTRLTGEDMRKIYSALAPGPENSSLYLSKDTALKIVKIKSEMKDTVFIIPTDALVDYLKYRMDRERPSIRRLMQLAEILEIPVYFLSTDEDYPDLKRLARRTGFGPLGGPYRGDFLMVSKEKNEYLVDELVSRITRSRFGLTVPTYESRRQSYADLAIELALTFLGFGVLWKKCVASARSLTDQE